MHYVYLLENTEARTRKIGITGDLDKRLKTLPGYSTVWVEDAGDCHIAARVESSVLVFLKQVAVFPLSDNKLSGFTEIFLSDEGPSTEAIIDLLSSVLSRLRALSSADVL